MNRSRLCWHASVSTVLFLVWKHEALELAPQQLLLRNDHVPMTRKSWQAWLMQPRCAR